PQYCRSMPVILRLQWSLLNLAYNSALVVTTAYWVFIVFIVDECEYIEERCLVD
ncbi:hypothetical protein BaRGS_00025116, partial [Batillaria attramentaria]